jgi:hypothetical protein
VLPGIVDPEVDQDPFGLPRRTHGVRVWKEEQLHAAEGQRPWRFAAQIHLTTKRGGVPPSELLGSLRADDQSIELRVHSRRRGRHPSLPFAWERDGCDEHADRRHDDGHHERGLERHVRSDSEPGPRREHPPRRDLPEEAMIPGRELFTDSVKLAELARHDLQGRAAFVLGMVRPSQSGRRWS